MLKTSPKFIQVFLHKTKNQIRDIRHSFLKYSVVILIGTLIGTSLALVFAPYRGNNNPLHLALLTGYDSPWVVRMLLLGTSGANYRINGGGTSLHVVAKARDDNMDTFSFLLDYHVDNQNVNSRDNWGHTPLHSVAMAMPDLDEITSLPSNSYLFFPAYSRTGALKASKLIDVGAELEAKDMEGKTPLQIASAVGSLPVVVVLLAEGADVNTQDDQGNTPLIDVAREVHFYCEFVKEPSAVPIPEFMTAEAIVERLLEAGADTTIKNKDGKTFLDYIKDCNEKNPIFAEIIEGRKLLRILDSKDARKKSPEI